MFDNILVPLDGSSVSEAALPYAEVLAARTGAKLTLIRAAQAPTLAGVRPAAQLVAVTDAEVYLSSLAEELRGRRLNVETGVPYGLSPVDWIVEEISLRNADIVVMGTHDRAGVDRWLRGSVAESVVSHATVPVLLIRAADAMQPAEHFNTSQPVFVVPLDGSELAEAAVPVAMEFARCLNGRLVLVGVIPEAGQPVVDVWGIGTYAGADHARLEMDAQHYLAGASAQVEADGLTAYHVVRQGDPAREIALTAQERDAAAVVMATHGRTGVARVMMGSIAGKVLHNSVCPVIVVRPARLRGTEDPVPVHQLAPMGA
jgi:nucleotide-binding universal stress UspA family protein